MRTGWLHLIRCSLQSAATVCLICVCLLLRFCSALLCSDPCPHSVGEPKDLYAAGEVEYYDK